MTTVAVGKTSFIARELARSPFTREWQFVSHTEALANPAWLASATTVINFAFPPHFKTQAYDEPSDIDSSIAAMIRSRPVHYIMLSTRMVYGLRDENFGMTENRVPEPSNPYGASKLQVERSLESILDPDRLTILRLSNIFGMERGRGSFFGRMMDTLATSNKIVFDMGAATQRDFFPAHRLSETLLQIVARPLPGIFNIGAGFATGCGDIAAWLMEGFGAGRLEVTNPIIRDQFSLDVSKAQIAWALPALTPDALREDVVTFGRILRDENGNDPRA